MSDAAARQARSALSRIAGGRLAALPVTVRCWDGSELDAAGGGASSGVLHLRHWLAGLDERRAETEAEIGAERARTWRLYLAAAAPGFEDGDTGVYQVLVARAGAPHGLPLQRVAP